MLETIRKDRFRLDSNDLQQEGYIILRKDEFTGTNKFLSQVLVTDERSKINSECDVIFDKEVASSIDDGDIGFISSNGSLRISLSHKANHNTILVTERCNNRCLFCSQPPKEENDDWLFIQGAFAIAAFQSSDTIGITGGEPLLYGDKILNLIDFTSTHTPDTKLHILTNGRGFTDVNFSNEIADRTNNNDIIFGVPLYSTNPEIHDKLVGSKGAYNETVLGIINAGNLGVPIELRIIPNKINIGCIESIVEYTMRCFSSISQISIMNLEPTGWAKHNWESLYLEPSSYLDVLTRSVSIAENCGVHVSLFNYPLCHISSELRPYAVKSISDWKNYYPNYCSSCSQRDLCTGYFASSIGKYHHPPEELL